MRKCYAKLRYDAEGTWYRSVIVDAESLDKVDKYLSPLDCSVGLRALNL